MRSCSSNRKGRFVGRITTHILVLLLIVNAAPSVALALEAGNIIRSSGIEGSPGWGDHTIIDTQNGAIIDWSSFDTSGTQSVTFRQYEGAALSEMSAVLNRISSGAVRTRFDGALYANGRVFVVNPAGVIFGAGSSVNVAQLVTSGLNVSDYAFEQVVAAEAAEMVFSGGSGDVINNGAINAGNSVYLVGKNVINNGSILCPGGLVVMAAGDALRLGRPAGSVIVDVSTGLVAGGDNRVVNNGAVGEPGSPVGRLVLAAGDVFSQAIPNVGEVAVMTTEGTQSGPIAEMGVIEQRDTEQTNVGTPAPVSDNVTADSITLQADAPDPGDSGAEEDPESLLTNLQRQWQVGAKLRSQPDDDAAEKAMQQAALLASSVPIPDEPELEIVGCPALTKWVAGELGVDGRGTQITIANSQASAASTPPCDACADLKRAATILRDYAGTRIAALSGVISEFASSDAPLSEEQNAAIAEAIASGARAGGEYALAGEYLDALAEYVGILNNEMYFPAAESAQFVLNKYVAPLAESENVAVAEFLAAKLTDLSGS